MFENDETFELDADTCRRIDVLAVEGNDLLEQDDWRGALSVWRQALALVPEPQTSYPESLWLYASIGDAHHSGEQWSEGVDTLQTALRCPDGVGSGYVWLRLGQCQLQLGRTEDAVQSLLSAYMLEGQDLVEGEDGWDLLVSRRLVVD